MGCGASVRMAVWAGGLGASPIFPFSTCPRRGHWGAGYLPPAPRLCSGVVLPSGGRYPLIFFLVLSCRGNNDEYASGRGGAAARSAAASMHRAKRGAASARPLECGAGRERLRTSNKRVSATARRGRPEGEVRRVKPAAENALLRPHLFLVRGAIPYRSYPLACDWFSSLVCVITYSLFTCAGLGRIKTMKINSVYP